MSDAPQPHPSSPQQPAPYSAPEPPLPPYGSTPQPYAYAPPGGRPRIPDSTPVNTPYIWILGIFPLVSLLTSLVYQPEFRYHTVRGVRLVDLSSIFTPAYFVLLAAGLVLYALQVVLAFLDRRELLRRGVERPFHWAWAFLPQGVYVIGRAIIVRRVAHPRGLAPMWLWVATFAVNLAVVFTITIARSIETLQQQLPH